MSIFCTAGLTLLYSDTSTSDYSFDEINSYRNTLSSFTGESMLSSTPWILSGIYTPWSASDGVDGHLADGWLYGESIDITDYYDDSAAIFRMDPDQKSTRLLGIDSNEYNETVVSGVQWWATNSITRAIGETLGQDANTYTTLTGSNWDYTGYRFVLDPTLPFLDSNGDTQTSVRDGSLSLVWYSYNGQEGLSGGLDIYGGSTLLASYSATDIVAGYNSASGFATTYDFNFNGTILNLNVRFDQEAIENGTTLMEAWTTGQWEMAVTSTSAGLFLDVENSNSYSVTMGSMISTFSQIYTFSMPDVDNDLINIVLWLMVGLPMTISLALIIIRITSAVHIL